MSHGSVAMRCVFLLDTVFLAAMPGWSMAQEAENELIQRERAWAEAMRTQNRDALSDIMAEEFVLTGTQPDRGSIGKDGWLLNTLNYMRFGEVEIRDGEAHAWGDVGVVRLHMTLDWWIGEEKLPTDFQLTDLWMRREGRWQVVTRLSEDTPPR